MKSINQPINELIIKWIKKWYKDITAVIGLMIAVTMLLVYFLDIHCMDLSAPLSYLGGDEVSIITTARLVKDCGWNTGTDRISATDDYYYNNNEIIAGLHNADVLLVKFFLMVGGNNIATAANLTFLAVFYLIAIVSYIVLRQLNLKEWLAASGALVYAFLAFVFMRGLGHIALSSYYFVPLAVLMAIWVYEDERFMLICKDFFKYKKNIAGIIMALLVATQGIGYWQVFGCFFILIAMVAGFLRTKDWKYINRGCTSIGCIIIGVMICCIPVFVTMLTAGGMDTGARYRGGTEAEVYGLKIVQLFLPVNGHGIDIWQELIDLYNDNMPLVNENKTAYIGFVGIIGFIFLIFWLFTNKKDDEAYRKRLTVLADMNVCAVILATVGGVGSMLYILGFNALRSYNRISVYIAFFCITAVCIVAQNLAEKIKKTEFRIAFSAAVVLFMMFAIWEQNPGNVLPHEYSRVRWNNEKEFVQNIENVMDEDDKIFQLPYVSYPEDEPHYSMGHMSHIAGYLHSDKLRWSFGTLYQSENDKWYEQTAELPVKDMVSAVVNKGFEGIYIDRSGYSEEEWTRLENELAEYLNTEPIVSSHGVLSFFKIQ